MRIKHQRYQCCAPSTKNPCNMYSVDDSLIHIRNDLNDYRIDLMTISLAKNNNENHNQIQQSQENLKNQLLI